MYVIIVIGVAFSVKSQVFACSCTFGGYPPLSLSLQWADAVFHGRVTSFEEVNVGEFKRKRATFEVMQVWQGPVAENLEVFTASGSSIAIAVINAAVEQVSDSLQNIGAITARLTIKESTLRIAITNTEAAKSRILDADIAFEQLESTRLQILQQTATAQLAQANVAPQNVLALFQ